MADYKDRLTGSATGVATAGILGPSGLVVAARDTRVGFHLQVNGGDARVRYGADANASQGLLVPSGGLLNESDWRGRIHVVPGPAAASCAVFAFEHFNG